MFVTLALVIALVIISIFFPSVWFVLVAYIVYLVLTKKTRRNKVITYEIQKLISTGQGDAVLKHLYYAAAKSFAVEHGARMSSYKNDPADDCLIFEMLIGGREYEVSVQRWMNDETMLTVKVKKVTDYPADPSARVEAFMSELKANHSAQ